MHTNTNHGIINSSKNSKWTNWKQNRSRANIKWTAKKQWFESKITDVYRYFPVNVCFELDRPAACVYLSNTEYKTRRTKKKNPNMNMNEKPIVSVSFAQKMLRFFYWLRCDWAGVNTIRLRPYIDELRCVCGMWALSLNDIYADADAAIVSVEWTRARAHTQTYENIYIASGGMERIVCVRLCCRPTIIIISMKNTYIL